MSDVRTIRRSFAGGEITPELYGRVDLGKFQTGLALARNFRILPHGPAVNREGTEYIIETKDSTKRSRLIPVTLSDSTTYVLEFGHQYVRFHSNGETVLETAKNITGVTQANPGVVTSNAHGFSNGQWVYVAAVGGMTQLNSRFFRVAGAAANTFTLQDLAGNAVNTSGYGAYTAGGTAARVYEIASPYDEAHVMDLHYAQENETLTLTHLLYAQHQLVITSPTSWAIGTISFDSPVAAPTGINALATVNVGTTGASLFHIYTVTLVDADGNESVIGAAGATPYAQNNLYTAGNRNTVSWTGNAFRCRIYKSNNNIAASGAAVIWGFIGETIGNVNFIDDNIEADYTRTPPENQTIFNAAGKYPAAVAYFEQRRVFAGSVDEPQTTWLTRSGSDSNMADSFPLRDDDPMELRIASLQSHQIRHVVPLDDLVLLTGSAIWRVYSVTSDALTPTTAKWRPISYVGASNVAPIVTPDGVLFEESNSGHLIELRYGLEDQQVYDVQDASLLAAHLFDDFSLRDLSFSSGPLRTCWAVRSDGKLLGLTYIPKQQVIAWHQHDTDGAFESVATVHEETEDGTYFVVQRSVNGRTVRYIERLRARATALVDSFFVDAGKTYNGSATTVITNAYHLEGRTVNVLADGAVHAQQVVSGGQITLSSPASVVHIGIPITAQLQTLPLDYESDGIGLGEERNVTAMHLRVRSSSSVFGGSAFDKLHEVKQRTSEPYGSPPAMHTGVVTVKTSGPWNTEGQVCVQQLLPLPIEVLALSLEVALGG